MSAARLIIVEIKVPKKIFYDTQLYFINRLHRHLVIEPEPHHMLNDKKGPFEKKGPF